MHQHCITESDKHIKQKSTGILARQPDFSMLFSK